MLRFIILTGVLAMPLKRSLEIGGFGDSIENDPLVPTLPVPTTRNQRNKLINRIYYNSYFLGVIEITCRKGFLSLSIYDSQVGLLISILIALVSTCASGGYFCIKKRNEPRDEGSFVNRSYIFTIDLLSPPGTYFTSRKSLP